MALATTYLDRPELESFYAAAHLFVDRALRSYDSPFTPGRATWGLAVVGPCLPSRSEVRLHLP